MTATTTLETSMRRGSLNQIKALLSSIIRQEEEEEIFYVSLKLSVEHFIPHYLKDVLEKGGKSLMHCWHSVISAILSCHEQQ